MTNRCKRILASGGCGRPAAGFTKRTTGLLAAVFLSLALGACGESAPDSGSASNEAAEAKAKAKALEAKAKALADKEAALAAKEAALAAKADALATKLVVVDAVAEVAPEVQGGADVGPEAAAADILDASDSSDTAPAGDTAGDTVDTADGDNAPSEVTDSAGDSTAVGAFGLAPNIGGGEACAQLQRCCADVGTTVGPLQQSCTALGNAITRLPEAQRGMMCAQGLKSLVAVAASVPTAPPTCKSPGPANKRAPAAPGAPASPTDPKAPVVPTPASPTTPTPATPTTPAPTVGATGAQAPVCVQARKCCAGIRNVLPQLAKACATLKGAAGPSVCAPMMNGLKQAAAALPQLGKPIPDACK